MLSDEAKDYIRWAVIIVLIVVLSVITMKSC